jgi:phosphatidylserine synthase
MIMLGWHDPRALAIACLFVFLGWGFDSLDGLAARGIQRSPAQGAVLDSLCDASTFGAFPAILLTAYGARAGRLTLMVSAVIGVAVFCCAVLRLRRYTVEAVGHAAEERTSFQGVPSPVAAMSISIGILAAITGPAGLAWLPMAFGAVAAPLMLSSVRYRDTPRLAAWCVRAKWPLPALAVIAYAAHNVAVALSVFFAAYLVSPAMSTGPVGTPSKSVQRRES